MSPTSAASGAGIIAVLLIGVIYLAFLVGWIWWSVYIALRLRDIGARLRTQEEQTRHLASIAASLAALVPGPASRPDPAPPAQ